jgi:hypothetical protein
VVPVAVHIGNGDKGGSSVQRSMANRGAEAAVARAGQHGDDSRVEVRRDHVLVSVAVEVADGHGERAGTDGSPRTSAEVAAAGADQDAGIPRARIAVNRRNEILLAVAVEICHGQAVGQGTDRVGAGGPKVPSPASAGGAANRRSDAAAKADPRPRRAVSLDGITTLTGHFLSALGNHTSALPRKSR